MPRLIKRKNNWYLIDASLKTIPQEGSAVIYGDSTPAFTKFIDHEQKTCFLSESLGEVSFDEFEMIVASTNSSDETPMLNLQMIENQLLKNFVFDTIGDKFGVNLQITQSCGNLKPIPSKERLSTGKIDLTYQ